MAVRLNGWEGFRYELQPDRQGLSRVTLVAGSDLPATVRFRNVRLREISEDKMTAEEGL